MSKTRQTYFICKFNFHFFVNTYQKSSDVIHMLYTNTDSLILQFFTHDLYKELLDVPQLRG